MAATEAHLLIGRRTVIETGNSQGVTIPQDVLADMGLEPGDDVTLVYDHAAKQITVEAAPDTGGVI